MKRRESEEKQTQTTKEIKKKKQFGSFFLLTLTTEFGSSSLALDLLSKLSKQSLTYIRIKH